MTDVKHRIEKADRDIDAKNAAHYVYYEIEKLEDNPNPEDVRKRWIWELLQNALDARGTDDIIAEVKYNANKGELVFLHNGRGFEADEILHLIKGGTSKDKGDKDTRGKFGRGFLTTYLLSPTVKIMGQLYENSWFNFTLERNFIPGGDDKSKDALAESLKRSLEDFENSISSDNKPGIPEGFTTQFIFSICGSKAEEAVNEGIDALEQCAPYVVVFNRDFFSINIKKPDSTKCFRLNDEKLVVSGIQQVTVVESDTEREYLLAENKQQETSVAVQMRSNEKNPVCLRLNENIPKLFSALPLVGTTSLSFPAVINSPDFSLPPDRDSVQFDKNRDFIEEACNLLVNLIEHAARERWDHVHQWAEIPHTKSLSEQMGSGWETCIENLIERICQSPAVHTLSGEPKSPLASILPGTETGTETETEKSDNVVVLWDLLKDWQEYREKLPRRDEAIGWYNALQSWGVYGHKAFNGLQLAKDIQDCSSLKGLRNTLQEGVCAVEWLDRFYDFLKKDGLFNNAIPSYSFVPNQVDEFRKLSFLDRDNCIDEELKDIDHILGGNLRASLRHTSLASLEDVDAGRELDNEDILGDIIDDLKTNANENLDSYKSFREASVCLFAWIVRKKQYTRLQDFPVFAKRVDSVPLEIINFPHPNPGDPPDNERPLAPVLSWANDLQDYFDLFPRRFIVDNAFFEAVSDLDDIWQTLEEKGFIRKDVIFQYDCNVSFDAFLPNEPLSDKEDHVAKEEISVTKIAYLTEKDIGIIDRVRKSSDLARKFWHFLTECVVVHDSKGLEIIENVPCACGETHLCYPAEWLEPVVKRSWIPIDRNKADIVTAENLANLFGDSGWDLGELNEHDLIDKLLKAIGISRLDLILATVVDNNDRETVDSVITEILRKSSGDVNHLNQAIKYIEAVTSNENLSEHVEGLLEATEDELSQAREVMQYIQEDNELFLQEFEKSKDRTRIISKNRSVGKQVEESVEQILRERFPNKKFNVKSVHKGADFEIVELEVTQGKKKLWIEVKSTQNEGDSQEVKMSSLQAKKAVKKKENFLLCVVPLPDSTKTDTETVRENMRFIANIGDEVASLCENLDWLEEVRDDITADTTSGVRLDVEKTKAGILVKKSMWKKHGFRLEELGEHLMQTNIDLVT